MYPIGHSELVSKRITFWISIFSDRKNELLDRGIIETARSGIKTFDSILKLQQKTDIKVSRMGTTGGKRGRNYVFEEYIALFR